MFCELDAICAQSEKCIASVLHEHYWNVTNEEPLI
jgi:hypothetical protein